jgi:tRNA A22 N-methylase
MDRLRQGLADRGYRIDAERLAIEGERISEVVRVVTGDEPHRGHPLWFGPGLAEDPLVERHAAQLASRFRRIFEQAPPGSEPHNRAQGWLEWLAAGRPS